MNEDTEKWLNYVTIFAKAHQFGRLMTGKSCDSKFSPERFDLDAFSNYLTVPDPEEPSTLYQKKEDKETKGLTVVICSPHPDDESLTGALPLRLRQENGASIVNLAITLGSNPERKKERFSELAKACNVLGFENRLVVDPVAFDSIAWPHKNTGSGNWQDKVDILLRHFQQTKPDIVLFPHCQDSHPTHVGVHYLTSDALKAYTKQFNCQVVGVESGFWQPVAIPKLLVAINSVDLALLITAVSKHSGEISRNPYHLRLPARLMDCAARGGELVRGNSASLPDFCFAETYDLSVFVDGERQKWQSDKLIFGPGQPIIIPKGCV